MNNLAAGAIGGCTGTLPMTLVMAIMDHYLPFDRRSPLPPRRITMRVTRLVGIRQHMDEPARRVATTAAHFAYGTAAGALYGLLARLLPAPPPLRGLLFGLVVWLVNYLGLLPAAGLLSSARDQPATRNVLMIVAHLVWGATMGLVTNGLDDG